MTAANDTSPCPPRTVPARPAALDVQIACIWEVMARKVGNVHPRRPFRDVSATDFLLSAATIAPVLADAARPLGERILQAVQAMHATVGRNTHLGTILLLAPLATLDFAGAWEAELARTLRQATVADCRAAYAAIRQTSPGGLGRVPQADVHAEPDRPLQEAMALAAERDLVARQYANAFAEVREFALPALLEAYRHHGCVEAAIIDAQVRLLAEFGDSLIARKNGPTVMEAIRQQARQVLAAGGLGSVAGRVAARELDRSLRTPDNRLNPGSTADLLAAALFLALRCGQLAPHSPFPWRTDDWFGPTTTDD